ncbi:MAG: thiamine pyrophosphate-dependent enzyme, partial [Coriobacteriia bacterium]|nr:thiamine pyrophosphate-dependent enzyme [Coriobacteriia bacterium]
TGTVVILDNRTTAMTGHQSNPMMGRTLAGAQNREVDVEALCASMGIEHVRVVDPHDLAEAERVVREEVARDELSVIVMRAPCALLLKEDVESLYAVNDESCTACGACVRLGCPAISSGTGGKAQIDLTLCVGCAQCVRVCRFDAIEPAGPACDIGGV